MSHAINSSSCAMNLQHAYIYVCVCVCVCARARVRARACGKGVGIAERIIVLDTQHLLDKYYII